MPRLQLEQFHATALTNFVPLNSNILNSKIRIECLHDKPSTVGLILSQIAHLSDLHIRLGFLSPFLYVLCFNLLDSDRDWLSRGGRRQFEQIQVRIYKTRKDQIKTKPVLHCTVLCFLTLSINKYSIYYSRYQSASFVNSKSVFKLS